MDIDSNENSLASNSSIYVNTNQTENENSDKSLLSKIYEDGKTGFSNQNFFEFGEESKSYTPVVNFFKCETNFECRPSKKNCILHLILHLHQGCRCRCMMQKILHPKLCQSFGCIGYKGDKGDNT